MAELHLQFTTTPSTDNGSFKLMELPPEICKLVESAVQGERSFVIKGDQAEDAVFCTDTKTYALRSVVLSNSVLVTTGPLGASASNEPSKDVVIRDTIHEVLELVPTLPRLQKLNGLLRGQEYDEGHDEDEDMYDDEGNSKGPARRLTYEHAREILQASDVEIARGLRARRVLMLNGELRPISPSYLTTVLELLLTYLVSLSLSHQSAPVHDLITALEDDHEMRRSVVEQVMGWFGVISDGRWKVDVDATVKEVGLGILRAFKNEPIPEDEFIAKWKTAVGDTFESVVEMQLLSGNYLSNLDPLSDSTAPLIAYFPASALPSDPAARFTDLFLTRLRWRADDISPFLADIVVDNKERDKLLLKYARAVTDSEGVWYTARAKLV